MHMSNAKEEKDMNVDGLHFSHESVQSQPVMPVRNYKDTVFRMLFSDEEELLVLYNAVNGTNYSDPDALEITTLECAVYKNKKSVLRILMTLLFLIAHLFLLRRAQLRSNNLLLCECASFARRAFLPRKFF